MNQERKNLCSTKATEAPVTETIYNQDQFPIIDPIGIRSHTLYANVTTVTGQKYSDLTGRFLQVSSCGNQYMLTIYNYDSNYIHVDPIKKMP